MANPSVPKAVFSASPEVPLAGILAFLDLRSVRSFAACGTITSWKALFPHFSSTLQEVLGSCKMRFQASCACPEPRRGWTEHRPRCSFPLCDADTGLWVPSLDEMDALRRDAETTDRGNGHEFECCSSIWGSETIRSRLAECRQGMTAAYVACCLDCGMALKEMARIRGRREYVLLASRARVEPGALGEMRDRMGIGRGVPVPRKHLLLSEVSDSLTRPQHGTPGGRGTSRRTRSAPPSPPEWVER